MPVITKIKPGVYQHTTDSGLVFNIVQIRDGDPGAGVNGKWYYDGGENGSEGGHDHFTTKRGAVAALEEYLAHRKYVAPYGWCYCPYD